MMSRRSLFLGTIALAATSLCSARAASKSQLTAARLVVQEILAANPIPALSVAVMRGDEILWAEAFGQADVELSVKATPQHRFRLGSVSKVITATLSAQLAARGAVDLDAPISRYMPELPQQHQATTLRQLLTHRGGIRHYEDKDWSITPPGPIDHRRYNSTADILAVFIDDPLIAPPGTMVSYSTFGYSLASLVLEAATKVPFLELIQREIAAPCGITISADAPAQIVPNRVSGYHPGEIMRRIDPSFAGEWGNIPQNNPAYKWAGGGLLATPTDLARFGASHLAAGKLSKEALTALFTIHTQATDRSPPLGLGWRIDRDGSNRLRWHHAGGQDGARASLVVYPVERLSIALATNVTQHPGDVNGPSAKIADAFAA